MDNLNGFDFAGLSAIIVSITGFFAIYFKHKRDMKSANQSNDEINAAYHEVNEKLLKFVKDHEQASANFIDLVKNDKLIDQCATELRRLMDSDRVVVYVAENYEVGIGIDDFDEKKRDMVHVTNESHSPDVISEKKEYKSFMLGFFSPIIREIEENNGIIVVNDYKDMEHQDVFYILETAGVNSVVDAGIYRQAKGHRDEYMIGALVVAYVTDFHKFTDQEITLIRNTALSISTLIENNYLRSR